MDLRVGDVVDLEHSQYKTSSDNLASHFVASDNLEWTSREHHLTAGESTIRTTYGLEIDSGVT